MTGSLAQGAEPGGDEACVRFGRRPDRHVRPASVEVEKPIAPPPATKLRPTWNVETTVEPAATASGSTSVACWAPGAFVVSAEIRTSLGPGACARPVEAAPARHRPARAAKKALRLPPRLIRLDLDFLSRPTKRRRTQVWQRLSALT